MCATKQIAGGDLQKGGIITSLVKQMQLLAISTYNGYASHSLETSSRLRALSLLENLLRLVKGVAGDLSCLNTNVPKEP